MMETVIFLILKAIVMLVLLVAMVMVLLGIKHLSNPRESASAEETEALKRDVDRETPGISRHSLFRQFIYSNKK